MKTLKFSEPLSNMILNGEKRTTWRINDEKGITKGDVLSLCKKDGMEFAKARVIRTNETTFGKLTSEDKEGHEKFSSDKECTILTRNITISMLQPIRRSRLLSLKYSKNSIA